MQGTKTSEPASDQLAALRTSILDDVFKDFNQAPFFRSTDLPN